MSLAAACWPIERIGDALSALARASGLALEARELPEPGPSILADPDDSAIDRWMAGAAATLSLEAEAIDTDLAGVGERYHPQWHEAHFWQPDAIYHGSQMPAQRQLFTREAQPKLTEQGKDVIAFLMTLKAPSGINKPWPEGPHTAPEGNANQGAVLFMRECTGCHGVQGMGVGPAARFFKSLRKPPAFASDQLIFLQVADTKLDSIYTMITNGVPGSAMPGFGNRLTDQERADLAAYVAKLGGYD